MFYNYLLKTIFYSNLNVSFKEIFFSNMDLHVNDLKRIYHLRMIEI